MAVFRRPIAIALVVLFFRFTANAGNGDLNDDGLLNFSDAALLRGHLLGQNPLTTTERLAADVNGDSEVDIADLIKLNKMVGLIEMVSVPAGKFTMGRTDSGDDAIYSDTTEMPRHEVTLPAYRIGKYEVTTGQFCGVLNWALSKGYLKNGGGDPYNGGSICSAGLPLVIFDGYEQIVYSNGYFQCKSRTGTGGAVYSMEDHPMVNVTWYGCVAFCNWLSQNEGLTPCYAFPSCALAYPYPNGYRLPAESEWERAAAWDGNKHWIYGMKSDTLNSSNCCNSAWIMGSNPLGFKDNPYSAPVGWYNGFNVCPNGNVQTIDSPSPAGCYDMSGNAAEWCEDWFHNTYDGAPVDGRSWETQQSPLYPFRVIRSGDWSAGHSIHIRTAARMCNLPDRANYLTGFRVARTP